MVRPTTGPLSQISQRLAIDVSSLSQRRSVPAGQTLDYSRDRGIGADDPLRAAARYPGPASWSQAHSPAGAWLQNPPGQLDEARRGNPLRSAPPCARPPPCAQGFRGVALERRARALQLRGHFLVRLAERGGELLRRQRLRTPLVDHAARCALERAREARRGIRDVAVDERPQRIATAAGRRSTGTGRRTATGDPSTPRSQASTAVTSCSCCRRVTAAGCCRDEARYPQSDGHRISTSRFVAQQTAQIVCPSAGHWRLAGRELQRGQRM